MAPKTQIMLMLLLAVQTWFSGVLSSGHPGRHSDLLRTRADGRARRDLAQNQTAATKPPRLAKSTTSQLDEARALVQKAQAEAAQRNAARLANPLRNQYALMPDGSRVVRRVPGTAPDLLPLTQAIRDAAALVAEADAYAAWSQGNMSSLSAYVPGAAPYWMAGIDHKGSWPWGKSSGFQVFRDVTQYGAKGDGVTDDTAAIQKAMADGDRCGPGCYSSTTLNAVVYFPPGTYLVSSTVETYYGTQVIGDAINPPTIKASSSFTGLGVLSTDRYVGGGSGSDGLAKEWFINTANFYRQIRNIKIDITGAPATTAGLHYQVAQASSLQNVDIQASTSGGTGQQGIFAENGSGGFMSDVTLRGGNVSFYTGNQQFTSHRVRISDSNTAIQLIWDWGWTWKETSISNCKVGFRLTGDGPDRQTGSVLIVDSVFSGVDTAVLSFPATRQAGSGTTGITLDNVHFDGVASAVADTSGHVYLAGSVGSVDTWALGATYRTPQDRSGDLVNQFSTPRDRGLVDGGNALAGRLPSAPYFTRARPQYENLAARDFVHMKDFCSGDGKSDDTVCFQLTLSTYAGKNPIYVDAGTYLLSDSISVPNGAVIVGEAWPQLVATGPNFGDAKKPRPLLAVGRSGERGTVEMQDLLFTSKGPTPGLLAVQWNLRAEAPGKAAMWDCHVRLGGATGTDLTSQQCPPSTTSTDSSACNAGSLMMHITPNASAYLENVWLWVADHDLDDPDWNSDVNAMTQTSVYVARGLLVQSTEPTWLYGTASEHAVFYQYTFHRARNVLAGEIQTESPYYQPNPVVPKPYDDPAVYQHYGGDFDYAACRPDAPGCDSSWALRVVESRNITIHGAGLYSWFQNYAQTCIDDQSCQRALVQLQDNHGSVRIHNLVTIGAATMIQSDGSAIPASDNLAVDAHPYWSQIAAFDPDATAPDDRCTGLPPSTNPQLPDGSWVDMLDTDEGSWLTIVNGTPLDFVFDSDTHDHMIGWDFSATVPAGEAVQYKVQFDSEISHPSAARGNATFRIGTTSKRFTIHCFLQDAATDYHVTVTYDNFATNDVVKGGALDLGLSRSEGHALNWVLTGSELYGYWSSANPPVAWQQAIVDVIGDRKLRYVTMPGTHDSGMSSIHGKTVSASRDNTQTQYLDYYHQLRRGARWFDTRPVIAAGGYWLGHYGQVARNVQGANGQLVAEVIDQINQFMRDYPGELVILSIDSDNDYDTDAGCCLYPRFTDDQWTALLDQFADGIERPCSGFGDRDLADATMNEFIGDGRGCVLMIVPGSIGTLYRNPDRGIYYYAQLANYNHETDLDSARFENRQVAEDQIARLQQQRNLSAPGQDGTRDLFHVMQWLIPNSQDVTTPLHDYAAYALGPLFWYAYSQFTPACYPNVLYVDYFGFTRMPGSYGDTQDQYYAASDGTVTALAMAVNLAIASQNCYVGGGKI